MQSAFVHGDRNDGSDHFNPFYVMYDYDYDDYDHAGHDRVDKDEEHEKSFTSLFRVGQNQAETTAEHIMWELKSIYTMYKALEIKIELAEVKNILKDDLHVSDAEQKYFLF